MSAISAIRGGGVTSARGYQAGIAATGIQSQKRDDLVFLVSNSLAQVAGIFSQNQIKSAPVKVSLSHINNGGVRGVVIHSGNANACTGLKGVKNAMELTQVAARQLKCLPKEILICSNGKVGHPLPMAAVSRGLRKASQTLSASNGSKAAKAILVNDSTRKEFAVRTKIDGRMVTIGGIAQGSHIVHPHTGAMLCVITTDALIDKATLKKCLEEAAEESFLKLCTDGLASPSDAIIAMANGEAGNNPLKSYHRQLEQFQKALSFVMEKLAKMVAADGEGISKVVELAVKGARSNVEAKAAALSIAQSLKVKTAWNAEEPDWGGIMSAIGGSDARVREELVEIYYNGLLAAANGQVSRTPGSRLRRVLRKPRFSMTIHLHSGQGEFNLFTTDLNGQFVQCCGR